MSKHTKANGKRKRGKRGQGRLFKKQGVKQFPADSPAAGTYYLTYTVEGKRRFPNILAALEGVRLKRAVVALMVTGSIAIVLRPTLFDPLLSRIC